MFWYFKSIYYDHLRFPYLVLFLIGLFFLFFKNKKIKIKNYNGIFYIFFISFFYLLIMTFYRNKDARFIEPLNIIFLIFISFWIADMKKIIFRKFMVFLLIFISIFNFYSITFGIKFIPEILESNFFGVNLIWLRQHGYTIGHPKRENWYLKEIFDEIIIASKKTIFILERDKMFLNFFNINYYKKLYAKNIDLNFIIDERICDKKLSYNNYEYIVFNSDFYDKLFLRCPFLKRNFKEVKNFFLPDNSKLIIFKKI